MSSTGNKQNVFTEFIGKYKNDPIQFVRDILEEEPDPWQKKVMQESLKSRLLAVKSGHGVGKSTCAAWLMMHHMLCYYPQKTVCTAPTASQLFDALFAELKSQLTRLPPALQKLFEVFSERIVLKSDPSGSFISCRTARKETPEALQGIHSDKVLLIVDEASSVDDAIFSAAGGSLSGNATLLLLGNPTRPEGYFYDAFTRLKDRWWTLTVNCEESPRVKKEYIDEMAERYGSDSNTYRIRVLGEFAESSDDTIISNELVESAVTRDVDPTEGGISWGLDVARYGSDKSALCKRRGNTILEPIKSWAKLDTMKLMGAINAEYKKAQEDQVAPVEILVDVIGIGASIVDRGMELGLPVVGINTGESASLSGQYKNLRCELWHKAKEWFEQRHCRIPRDERLMFELCSPRYSFESSGKIRMETKEEMKKRIGHRGSPDFADAFVLTFAGNAATTAGLGASWQKPLMRNIPGII
ncbi:MAG: putative terminase large subunit [Prokaryotic dsDNA virus sp.]|nr:MAG: putative terminase large subunit [Prokaryotic dsDNA virus sp.]|tara:strand:- start:14033 stop:15445 length:1413 start_codon:yes stop_codon:yes gene_type:complete